MIDPQVRALTSYFPEAFTFRSRRKFNRQTKAWLKEKPETPWTAPLAEIPDYRSYAANSLLEMLKRELVSGAC